MQKKRKGRPQKGSRKVKHDIILQSHLSDTPEKNKPSPHKIKSQPPQRLHSSYIDKWRHCAVIITVIHSLFAMGMVHLLHYIGADTAGASTCFPVTVYYRLPSDIYKYLVICNAICIALLNCHYCGGNWAQSVINCILLSWGGSCLFLNAAFTLQINHRQITINYYLVALRFCISSFLYDRNTRNMETYYFFINSGDTVIKSDLASWPMSDRTRKHYTVCLCGVRL